MKYLRPISALATRLFVAATSIVWVSSASAADSAATASSASSVVAAQTALQGSTAGAIPGEVLVAAAASAGGYDWTLFIALVLGLVGLIWMRRHIANL
ncbi:MAG: hypothetical protein ACR2PZ_25870 [Pseudomonadales bacterium]